MRRPKAILVFLVMLASGVSTQPSSFEPSSTPETKIKWTTKTIRIALSTSLTLSPSNVAAGSDVVGAVERALNSWAAVADIEFVVVSSKVQSISPASGGDGINLITIAPTSDNLAIFGEGNNAARTRVFYDRETGKISEADIVINPFPYSAEGQPLQFSTDGTPGTYDLESTFAHEIGHLLGLNHSSVIAATMQASQGLNGTYGLPALSERSLSEADQVAIRDLYGPCENSGSVKGRILNSSTGNLVPASNAHVWLEELTSGRVVASGLTSSSGRFSFDCLPVGDYRALVEYVDGAFSDQKPNPRRAFRSSELTAHFRVAGDKAASLNYVLVPPQNSPGSLQPRFLGINGDLSTIPVPATAGTKLTVYIGGAGVDQVPGTGFLVISPFVTVDPASLTLQQVHNSTPVISFEVTLGANAPAGDYSIRLQSNSGEVAYLVGAITIDPGNF